MSRKLWIAVFLITFIGTCGIITVDQQCREITGEGGKIGVSLEFIRDFK